MLAPLLLALAQQPDVAIIIADDLAWYDVDTISTPALDRLAAVGSTYRRFQSYPVCSPTRYALQFGRWPRRDGFLELIPSGGTGDGAPVAPPLEHPCEDLFSLGDLFKGQGYESAYFGKWHAGLQFYGEDGFAHPNLSLLFMGWDHWLAGTISNLPTGSGSNYNSWIRLDDGDSTFGVTQYSELAILDAVEDWWAAPRIGKRPRVAVIAFHLPHPPLHVPDASLAPAGGFGNTQGGRGKYEAMVQALDVAIDRLLVIEPGDPDGTIDLATTCVVFMSDNGTPPAALGPGQTSGKLKTTTFRDGIQCPLIAAGVGIQGGLVDDTTLVSPVDMFATFADLLGVRIPVGAAEDSSSLLRPVALRRDWVLSEHVKGGGDDLALLWKNWKFRRFNGTEVVYDLDADPDESQPIPVSSTTIASVVAQFRSIEAIRLPPRP